MDYNELLEELKQRIINVISEDIIDKLGIHIIEGRQRYDDIVNKRLDYISESITFTELKAYLIHLKQIMESLEKKRDNWSNRPLIYEYNIMTPQKYQSILHKLSELTYEVNSIAEQEGGRRRRRRRSRRRH